MKGPFREENAEPIIIAVAIFVAFLIAAQFG